MGKEAILTEILRRNALRREARLPTLDVPAEYARALAVAHWREVHELHYERVRNEILERLRQRHGEDLGQKSAGGRWIVEILTARELHARFGAPGRPALRLGYGALDATLRQAPHKD